MHKTSPSLPDSYPQLSRSFFINTSFSGRAGCHPVTWWPSPIFRGFLSYFSPLWVIVDYWSSFSDCSCRVVLRVFCLHLFCCLHYFFIVHVVIYQHPCCVTAELHAYTAELHARERDYVMWWVAWDYLRLRETSWVNNPAVPIYMPLLHDSCCGLRALFFICILSIHFRCYPARIYAVFIYLDNNPLSPY